MSVTAMNTSQTKCRINEQKDFADGEDCGQSRDEARTILLSSKNEFKHQSENIFI